MTYDDWLALTEEQRREAFRTWNPYQRENEHIPAEAARRLAAQCGLSVLGTGVGVYHGPEYILHIHVPEVELARAPEFLQSSFDGFRVAYLAGPPSS